jgi:hypothetical protein
MAGTKDHRHSAPVAQKRAPSVSNLSRQRQAVAAHKQRMRVVSTVFAGGGMKSALVAIAGEYYEVDPRELARLEGGASPASLGLIPYPDPDHFGAE